MHVTVVFVSPPVTSIISLLFFAGIPDPVIGPASAAIAIDGGSSSDDVSSDPDDPVSRGARRAAIRAAEQSYALRPFPKCSTIADFFKPISCVEYLRQVDIAAQPDPLDLRSVVPASAADIVSAVEDDESGSSFSPSPKRRRYGYELDGFIVNSSESDASQ